MKAPTCLGAPSQQCVLVFSVLVSSLSVHSSPSDLRNTEVLLTSETLPRVIMGSLPGQDAPGSFPPPRSTHPPPLCSRGGHRHRVPSPQGFLTTVPLTEDFDDLMNNPPDTLTSELPSSLPDTLQFQPHWACPCQAPTPKSLLHHSSPHPSNTTWMLLVTGPPAPPGPLGLLFQSLPSEPYL